MSGFSSGGVSVPPPLRYLFIDGGYLRARYTEMMNDFFGTGTATMRDIDFIQVQSDAMKAFYYDCIDDQKKSGESDDAVEKRAADQEDFFNSIRSIPGYHVILGSMSGTKPKTARQKQVDVHLAVDVLNHAVRHNMSQAVLLTGDLDFKPAIEALIDLGIWVRLHYVRGHATHELVWSADQGVEIDFRVMYRWSKRAFQSFHPVPSEDSSGGGAPAGSVQLKVGSYRKEPVWLYGVPESSMRTVIVQSVTDEVKNLKIHFSDVKGGESSLAMIEKFFKTVYGGEIQW